MMLHWSIDMNISFFIRSLVDLVHRGNESYIHQPIRKRMHRVSVTMVLIRTRRTLGGE
jgi:hypothetical protein